MMGMAVISCASDYRGCGIFLRCRQGFGAELRRQNMSTFRILPFPTLRSSPASLVTRLTNDVNNMQMTLMMGMRLLVRAPVMLVAALVLSIG